MSNDGTTADGVARHVALSFPSSETVMDVRQELQTLIESELKFSLEFDGRGVLIWVGDYLRESTAVASVATLEEAVKWLLEHGSKLPCPDPV